MLYLRVCNFCEPPHPFGCGCETKTYTCDTDCPFKVCPIQDIMDTLLISHGMCATSEARVNAELDEEEL